jgi:hypothetical protein
MNEKERTRLNIWNASVKAYIKANSFISVAELCRRANVHKSDMSRFLNGKRTFGILVLRRIEEALATTGYKTTDPKVKRLKQYLSKYQPKKRANEPKLTPFFDITYMHRDGY